jgi:hypothetical protein
MPELCLSDFGKALQLAVDNCSVLHLHAPITIDEPVAIKISTSNQGWFGLDGGLNRITSTVKGAPALRFYMDDTVPVGTCARAMMLKDFSMIGGGKEEGGLELEIPFNDRWLGNLELRSLWFEDFGGKAACSIKGSIFESFGYNVGTMDNAGAGLYFANAGDGNNRGIVSAFRLFGGTHRQNGAQGILIDQYDGPADVRMFGLYFVGNKKEGLVAMAGLELVDACGFENNGYSGIYVENFATLRKCTGSTYGPQAFLVNAATLGQMTLSSCSVTGYSGGAPKVGRFTGNGHVILSDTDPGGVEIDSSVTMKMAALQ